MKKVDPESDTSDNPTPEELRELGQADAIDALLRMRRETGERLYGDKPKVVAFPSRLVLATAAVIAVLLAIAGVRVFDQSETETIANQSTEPIPAPETDGYHALAMQVTELDGAGLLHKANGDPIELKIGDLVLPSESVSVSEGSSLKMTLADESEIHLVGGSLLENQNTEDKKIMFLARGDVNIDAMPQPEGRRLEVHTPNAFVEVIGTRFEVTASDMQTELFVEKGLVEIGRFEENGKSLEKHEITPGLIAEVDTTDVFVMKNDTATPEITDFSFIDSTTGEAVPGYDPIYDGQEISLSELPEYFNIKANSKGKIRVVTWTSNLPNHRHNVENKYPYVLHWDRHQKAKHRHGKLTINQENMWFQAIAVTRAGKTLEYDKVHLKFVP
ncbi:MAG: FecR family protein [Opitutales bacterium]